MDLKQAIEANFIDADGLVSPHPCLPDTRNASNNGVCYTGEYETLLTLTGQYADTSKYNRRMEACEAVPGCIKRSPINNTDLESPDDYYGLMAGLYFTRSQAKAKTYLDYGKKNYGSFDNLNPNHFNWTAMIWRDPGLLAMNTWAAGHSYTPLNALCAIIIAFSCLGLKQTDGCDPWRLTWLLVQPARRKSILCRWASKIWYNRLDKTWGGMANVAKNYYQGLPGQDHPFVAAFAELDSKR